MKNLLKISDRKMVIGSLLLLAAFGGFILSISGIHVGMWYGIIVGAVVWLVHSRRDCEYAEDRAAYKAVLRKNQATKPDPLHDTSQPT